VAVDVADFRPRLPSRWVVVSLVAGVVLSVGWSLLAWRGLNARVVRDAAFFLAVPLLLAAAFGKSPEQLGWTVDRRALRNTVALSLFVLPFYLVGASLPTIRGYYPMWGASADLGSFLPHAAKQMVVVLAGETFYRGLLCVGVSEVGFKSVFISPVVYAVHHTSKPPIELALSGPTDVLFGAVDYDCGSILPSVVAHGLGLTLLDWLVLHDPLFPPGEVTRWLRWLPIGV
jgi:hypothetical protein